MDIVICKQFATMYESINARLEDLENQGNILQTALCQDKSSYKYELPSKKVITERVKAYAALAKQTNEEIKLFKSNIELCKDSQIKIIYKQRYDILVSKYTEQIKKIILVKGKYVTYAEEKKVSEEGKIKIQQQLYGEPDLAVFRVYSDATTRSQEIQELVVDIVELRQMFEDLAILLSEQHEMLDQIEIYVEEAQVRVNNGNKKLTDSIQLQKKSRKKMCCCALVLIVIVVIIIFVLIARFGII
jgi:t-SNARE complex subunit (syntaxin)